MAARLPSQHWPQRPVLITAVDARTGEPVVFDRHSGIDLVDAVAASTANGFGPFPPYRIGGNRYINGGYRRSENADLAAGYGRVLVLSPFGGRSRMPPAWGMDLETQVKELRAAGSRVETVFPDRGCGEVSTSRRGSVDAPAGRARRLRPRQSPGRAAHRVLALTRSRAAAWLPGTRTVPGSQAARDGGTAPARMRSSLRRSWLLTFAGRALGQGSQVRGVRGWWRSPAAALAHGLESVADAVVAHVVHEGGHQPRAGPTERMAEGDGPAIVVSAWGRRPVRPARPGAPGRKPR